MKSTASSKLKVTLMKKKMQIDKLRGKKIIILDIEELAFIPYILPIYESLKSKTTDISYYIGTYYQNADELKVFDIPARRQFSPMLSKNFNEADIFLSPHIYGAGNPDSVRIHINHNQPVKYEAYQKENFINFDVHFLTSPLHREQTENIIKMYDLGMSGIKLYDIGYAKSDKLLQGMYKREDVLNKLGLNAEHKTILYAPSWDEGLSLRTMGEKVIENILRTGSINLIVKLHPISYCPPDGPNYEFYTGGIDWVKKLEKFEAHKNFRHIKSGETDPLLAAADLLITDVSSVALEFIVLDKPVLYIECPEFYERTLKKVYSNFGNTTEEFVKNDPKANAGRHVGEVVYDIAKLPEMINQTLLNPEKLSDKRREFAKRLTYNPGNAADAAAEKIVEILKHV